MRRRDLPRRVQRAPLKAFSAAGRPVKTFNPVARPDSQLFVALMSGEHAVHGFANRNLRATLTGHLRDDPTQQSAQISRLLHRLYVYGLVAKIPRAGRWRVTAFAFGSWAPRSDSGSSTFPRSTPRRREERRGVHCTTQRTNDERI